MELLWLQPDLAAYKGVVCVVIRTVVRACMENLLDCSTPDQNQVQLVPVLRARMPPGELVLGLGFEGVSDAEILEGAQLK